MGGFLKTTLCTSAGVSGISGHLGSDGGHRKVLGGTANHTGSASTPGGKGGHAVMASRDVRLRRSTTAISSTINPRSSRMDPRFRGGITFRTALRGGSVVE